MTKTSVATATLLSIFASAAGCESTISYPDTPKVVIVAPIADALVSGQVTVQSRIYLPLHTLASVELQLDGETVHTAAPAAELSQPLDVSRTHDGPHMLRVVALDATGTAAGEASRSVFVDNGAPTLSITEPTTTRLFVEDGPAPFVVRLGEGSAAERVTLWAGDLVIADVASPLRAEVAAELPLDQLLGDNVSATIRLVATAVDAGGTTAEASMEVTVTRHLQWLASEDPAYYAPVLAPGIVVLGTDDRFVVYDRETGAQRCRLDGPITSAPLLLVPQSNVVWWSTTDAVRVVDLTTCAATATRAAGGDVVTGMVTTADGIAIVTFFGRILLLGPDMTERWSTDLAAAVTDGGTLEVTGAIGIAPDDTIYVAGSLGAARGAVFTVRDGIAAYAPLPASVSGGLLATGDGCFVAASDGRLYRIAPDLTRPWTPAPLLSDGAPIECTPVIAGPGIVATCDGDSTVHGLDVADGTALWTYAADGGRPVTRIMGRGGLVASPDGGRFAIGDRLGILHVIDTTGRLLWKSEDRESATGLTAPAVDETSVAVADDAGVLALYDL